MWSGNLVNWLVPVLAVAALALAFLGQASLARTHLPRWLVAPYPFVAGLLLLILATWRPQPATPRGLRQWLVPAVGPTVALLCAALAVSHFRRYEGFTAGLLLSALSIAAAGAALVRSEPQSGSGVASDGTPLRSVPDYERATPLKLAPEGPQGERPLYSCLPEALLLIVTAVAMIAALFLWWKEKEPNLAFALNALAFLAVLWLALRLDRRSTTLTRNLQSPIPNPKSEIRNPKSEWLALFLILLAALFLRTHRLLDMPYGVWYDEGEAGLEAVKIYEGGPFSPIGYYSPNNPSLFFYLAALGFKILGPDLWTLRLVTAAVGVATVGAAYLLFRLLFGWRAALIAAGLLAASSWHVNFSRIGMGYTTLVPFFETMSLYFLVRGLRQGRWADFAFAGLMLGLGMYSHTAFRIFPLAVVIYVLYILVSRHHMQRRFSGPFVAVVVSFIVFAPLGVWAVKHPIAFFGRTAQTSFLVGHDTPQSALRALKGNVEKHALMFNVRGDRNGRHNLPGAPQLDAVSAALFVLGVGYSLYCWRNPACFLLAAWFAIAMLGGVLSLDWEAPQAARTIGAIPAVYGMAALPLALAWQLWSGRGWGPAMLSALAVGMLLLGAFRLNYDRYFNKQQRNPEVFHAFSTPDTAIARYVQAVGEDRYRFYLQNQFTPVYRFLTYRPGGGSDRQEVFFRAVDHLPVRDAVSRDVMYVLEPWRVALPIEAFARYYPRGAYEEVTDPFGKAMFYSYAVKQADVAGITGLTGRYFAAAEPAGEPRLRRRDQAVDFDWTAGSSLGQEPLSARWEGALFAPQSGVYALGTQSWGRSQVFLDGNLIVDNPGGVGSQGSAPPSHPSSGWAEGVRPLAKGWHQLAVTCFDCGSGVMQLYWSPPGGEAGIVPTDVLSTVPPPEHGLQGEYYAGTEPTELPVFTQVDPVISFRWHDDPIPVPWNAQWNGWLDVEKEGEYQFQLFSNDQAGLYLDDETVVSGRGRLYGLVQLDRGRHAIRVTYSNTRHYSELRLWWIPPGATTWEPIPTERLRPG